MKRAAVATVAVLVVGMGTGCRTTAGKVLGATYVASTVAGSTLLIRSEEIGTEPDLQAGLGLGLMIVSLYALLAYGVVEQ
jgi:hypothetical protein